MTATNIAALRVRVRATNNKLASVITTSVGTMACAYLFGLLALVSLPAAIHSGDPIVIIGWIAQTFLQLVLLPIIIVGQNLQQTHNQAHKASLDELHAKVDAQAAAK